MFLARDMGSQCVRGEGAGTPCKVSVKSNVYLESASRLPIIRLESVNNSPAWWLETVNDFPNAVGTRKDSFGSSPSAFASTIVSVLA